ncbi:hypothetical protein EOL70_10600 [Leucothrix sargassi]|nr:hypothetical protein EOL70_10600 [Leucothrix sargassi]
MFHRKLTQLSLIAFTALFLSQASLAAGTSEDEENASTDWKTEVLQDLEDKYYQNAFKRLLEAETDNADTSADWHNLMGYTMRMLDMPDLEASEHHYIKAVELKADHKGALEYYGELKLQQDDLEGAKKLLSRLEEVCPDGCEELDTLKKSVEAYEAKQK